MSVNNYAAWPLALMMAGIAGGGVAAQGAGQQAAALHMVPHRAVYDVAVTQSKSGKNRIASAQGRLVYEFTGSACEGYSTNLRFVTQMSVQEPGADGGTSLTDVRSTTFEAADGTQMRFLTSSLQNNQLRDKADGTAKLGPEGGEARLRGAGKGAVTLPAGTVFPTRHLMGIISAATKGEKLYGVDLYDGSDGGAKVFGTMAVIGRQRAATGSDHPTSARGLNSTRRWPVTISFFETSGSGETTPLYELTTDLLENGISYDITLDYRDFALKGTMSKLELLPVKPCP